MAAPRIVKIKKGNVEFISRTDLATYTLKELVRAALAEIGRVVIYKRLEKLSKVPKDSMTASLSKKKKSGGMNKLKKFSAKYWVGKQKNELILFLPFRSWYSQLQEVGGAGPAGKDKGLRQQPRKAWLRDTVFENIDTIVQIQSQYLKHLNDDKGDNGLIDEREYDGSDIKETSQN